MISLETVENDIAELEKRDTCFATCERLAWLYIVRDHLKGYNVSPEAVIALNGSSEFLQAVNGKNPERIMPIMDELAEAIKTLHPRMYSELMEKVKDA